MAQKNTCTWQHTAAAAGLLVIIAACLVSAGCMGSTGAESGGESLAGSAWTLLSYAAGNGTAVPVLQGTAITANFTEDGRVTGSAGCNGYGGNYVFDGDRLAITSIASTLMACTEPPGIMDQEARYLDLLGSVAAFQLEGDRLVLLDANGTPVLTYERAAAPETTLEGPTWELLSYSCNASMVPVISGTTVTATFGNGSVGGSAGCNSYGGAYTVDGSALTVGEIFRTEMYCLEPAGVMEQEDRYLDLLGRVAGCQIEGGQLTLVDAGGNATLFFEGAA
ncbi:META domain-containing protein [Methanoculleus frigidifontis]|nr:META domain-containing protein [Methanoculleus sp. FWC-SCC1]